MAGPLICPNCAKSLDEDDKDVFLWQVRGKFYCSQECGKVVYFITGSNQV